MILIWSDPVVHIWWCLQSSLPYISPVQSHLLTFNYPIFSSLRTWPEWSRKVATFSSEQSPSVLEILTPIINRAAALWRVIKMKNCSSICVAKHKKVMHWDKIILRVHCTVWQADPTSCCLLHSTDYVVGFRCFSQVSFPIINAATPLLSRYPLSHSFITPWCN